MFKKIPLRPEPTLPVNAARKTGSRIGQSPSGAQTSMETRTRSHSISINENGNFKTEGEITKPQEQLIRGAFLVIKSQEEGIIQMALEYVESLMRDQTKYANILVFLFGEEVEIDASILAKSMETSVQRLSKISDLIRLPGNDDLDKQYLIMMEYFPERKKVESLYEEKVTTLCNKYPIFWKTRKPKHQIFMRDNGTTIDVKKTFQSNIFRDLATHFCEQLPELAPYAKNFTDKKSYRKQLERVLLGMCDYDCFKWQYQSTAGSRTYLGSFSQSVERVCEAVHKRGPNQWEDKMKWKRFTLTYSLWKLYTSLVAIEDFSNRLTKLYRGAVPPRQTVIDDNPGAYLIYATCSIQEIESRLDFDFIIRQDSDGILSYLNITRSYMEACGNIFDTINVIVQILREIQEQEIPPPPTSPLPAPSSSRRRKTTITDLTATPLPKSMEDIYAKFSIISPKIKGQLVALEQILM